MISQPFDAYQFHDNLVHGLSFLVENFRSELHLDLDYILQWPNCLDASNKGQLFAVSKSLLKFYDVTDLSVNIDWGDSGYTTAVSGICIDMVERVSIPTTLRFPDYYKWEITMSDGRSLISFGSSSMTFELIGNTLSVPRQFLLDGERNPPLVL
jgi:hypothetical protein